MLVFFREWILAVLSLEERPVVNKTSNKVAVSLDGKPQKIKGLITYFSADRVRNCKFVQNYRWEAIRSNVISHLNVCKSSFMARVPRSSHLLRSAR